MALRVAVATGNWSNPAIWNGGVLPSPGDIVASNGFTVTIDQNININILTNKPTASTVITPLMTSNTTPSGIVSASSNSTNYDPWKAFDGNFSSTEWLTATNTPNGWLAYEFTSPKVVGKYMINPATASAPASVPRDWTFEGWNGSTWIVLDTVTGNSGTANVVRTFVNTTAYIKYRINITLNNGSTLYTGIRELYLYEPFDYVVTSTTGGQFIINDGANVILTNPVNGLDMFMSYTYPSLIVYNGTGSCSITATFATNYGYINIATNLITITNSGTLNLLGDFSLSGLNNFFIVGITGIGTLNFTGTIKCQPQNTNVISRFATVNTALATVYITGTIDTTSTLSPGGNPVFGTLAGKLYIVGNITTGVLPIISSTESNYLSIIGTISNDTNGNFTTAPAVTRSSTSAINIFSGPFICGKYGYMPIQCARMHLIPSVGNYFEFRDETTNGAVSPGAIAPATRLVSPATLVDNLAVNNVRFGVLYALGTLTGTLRMPTATQVTSGIQVDNTFGSAVLTIDAIWDYLVTNINTPDSIGMRLKNVSTPQTTGEQLEAFLKLD